jgi:hypothetical protein
LEKLRRLRPLIAIGDCDYFFEFLMDAWRSGRVATPACEKRVFTPPVNSAFVAATSIP